MSKTHAFHYVICQSIKCKKAVTRIFSHDRSQLTVALIKNERQYSCADMQKLTLLYIK